MDAQTVIRQARDLHPKFTDLQHPDSVLFAALGRQEDALLRRGVAAGALDWATTADTALPLATFADGIALTGMLHVHHVTAIDSVNADIYDKVNLLPLAYRDDMKLFPSAYVEGGTLYLTGTANDWLAYGTIQIHYTPTTTAPTTLASTLTLGDTALPSLAYGLGTVMATRESDIALLQIMQQQYGAAVAQWLDDIVNAQTAYTFTVREVF